MEVIPGGCISVFQVLLTISSQARSGDPQVSSFTVTKMLKNIIFAQKQKGKSQTANTLISNCDFSNSWV